MYNNEQKKLLGLGQLLSRSQQRTGVNSGAWSVFTQVLHMGGMKNARSWPLCDSWINWVGHSGRALTMRDSCWEHQPYQLRCFALTWRRGHMNDHAQSHTCTAGTQCCYYARLMLTEGFYFHPLWFTLKAEAEVYCCNVWNFNAKCLRSKSADTITS